MSDELLVDMVKGIAQDVKEVKSTVSNLQVDHKEIAVTLKGHIDAYESDKFRYNNNIEYTQTLHKVVEGKFDDVFKNVDNRVKDTEVKLNSLEDKIKSIKYWDNMSRILYTTGGTLLGFIGAGASLLIWLAKNGSTLVK